MEVDVTQSAYHRQHLIAQIHELREIEWWSPVHHVPYLTYLKRQRRRKKKYMTENILCELCDLHCIINGYINFRLKDMNKHKIRTEVKRKKNMKKRNEKSGKVNNQPISFSNKFVITNLVSISMNIKYQLLWMFFNLFLMTAWKFHSNFNSLAPSLFASLSKN